MSAAPEQPAPPRPRRPARRVWRLAGWSLVVLFVAAVVALLGAATWLTFSTRGLQTVLSIAQRVMPGQMSVDGVQGALARDFSIDRLRLQIGRTHIEIDHLRGRLAAVQPALQLEHWRIGFDTLHADRLAVRIDPSTAPRTTAGPPASIATPLTVSAQSLTLGRLIVAAPNPLEFTEVSAAVVAGPDGYRIDQGSLTLVSGPRPLRATLAGTLHGRRPFATEVQAQLQADVAERGLVADVTAAGSLEALRLQGRVTDRRKPDTPGEFSAQIASFEPPTVRALTVKLQQFDPSEWVAQAPQASLTVQADLSPRPGPAFTLGGPVTVTNAAPGPLDAQRLPLRRLQTQLSLDAERIALDDTRVELTRGRVTGRASAPLKELQRWQATLRVDGVDPSTLHSRARRLLIDGELRAEQRNDTWVAVGDLRDRGEIGARLRLDLQATREQITLNETRLTLAQGEASARGSLALTGTRALQLNGQVRSLDLAKLVNGIDARLNFDFDVDGQLAPRPQGRLRFVLADSRAWGHPLTGQGAAQLQADESLTVDTQLAARSLLLEARGALGRQGQSLALRVVSDRLQDLGLPVAGRLELQGRFSGDWRAPAADLQLQAQALRYQDQQVDQVRAVVSYAGGTDGAFGLQLDALGHQWRNRPAFSQQTFAVSAQGKPSQHHIEINGTNAAGQPVVVAALGGWQIKTRSWLGQLQTAEFGALDLRLLAPAEMTAAAGQFRFGPADWRWRSTRIEQLRFAQRDGQLSTSGRFSGLTPQTFATTFLEGPKVTADPLRLAGQWQFTVGTRVDGSVRIERSSGDLYAGAAAQAMGIDTLWAQLDIQANRLQARASLRSERAGRADAQLQAELERAATGAGWRLSPARPLSADVDAELPSIDWVNSLFSERIRANLRIGGSGAAKLRVRGTADKPDVDGTISGEALRVAWIEQGIRLENGQLRARLQDGALLLESLRFVGPARIGPPDKRIVTAAGRGEGVLDVTGRLQLQPLSGVLQLQAQKLPLLQRRDRWVMVNGGGNLVFDPKRIQFAGAVAADAGFIDISKPDLPSLAGDVEVTRAATRLDSAGGTEAPVAFGFDLGIDLGPAFYVRGMGVDTRLTGAVRLRSEGRGQIRASGAVETQDGIYEGFGQRLAIERGRLNFQGPVENPGLDILALRKGLSVEVGVSITRTAANPLIRLYSQPPMPDAETLSWLVLGRPAEEGSNDRTALARAAAGLLSGNGEGVPAQLARRLGIDEISLRSGSVTDGNSTLLPQRSVAGTLKGDSTTGNASATGEIVTIGKRLNDAITLSYEQAVSGASNVLQISYQVSRRVSVIARTGTENALDLVYTFAFD